MKTKDTNAHDGDTSTRRLPWDADNTIPGAPTSLDVLLSWLTAPGKYSRLHSGQKGQAVHNIFASLKKNGINHRTASGIRNKVRSIEEQYLTARNWLEEKNVDIDDVLTSNVDKEIEAEVLALCPLFIELLPVFRHSNFLNERNAAGFDFDSEGPSNYDNKSKIQKRKRETQTRRPNKQRKRTESVSSEKADETFCGEPNGLIGVDQTQHDVLDLNGEQNWFQRSDKCEIVVRETGLRFSPDCQRDVDQVKLNHLKKHSEAVLKSEDSMRKAVMKSDLEAKRSRDQVQLQLDMVMARQTMTKEGVPEVEIERAMPLLQLQKNGRS